MGGLGHRESNRGSRRYEQAGAGRLAGLVDPRQGEFHSRHIAAGRQTGMVTTRKMLGSSIREDGDGQRRRRAELAGVGMKLDAADTL